ncbi:MAG TPA: GxGYxYP domain-containing protein [bacterium]|nr:GxGYxYP domain-containing protein [bacterium]
MRKIADIAVLSLLLWATASDAWAGEGARGPDAAVPGIFHRSAAVHGLYVIESGELSNEDWHLATVVQGMASRGEPSIYLVNRKSESRGDEVLLDFYEQEYGIRVLGEITVQEALNKFAGLFQGYALFSFAEPWTVNVADTWCSIHDCLPVTPEQEALAREAGLKKAGDFRGRFRDARDAIDWSLKELFPYCSIKTVASLSPRNHTCRDYLFAHRIFTFYLTASGRDYFVLSGLLKKMPRDIPTMGYIARSGPEEWIVEYTLAASSKFMAPTDLVPNLTVHSGIPIMPLPESAPEADPPDLRGKLGVVFAFTDGDNLFIESERYLKADSWLCPERGKIKAAWSFAPELYELAPGIMRYYYETRTDNDFFVALSGAGYTFTSAFRDQEFFRDVSIDYMKLTGMDVLWSLDPLLYVPLGRGVIGAALGPLGRDPWIKGLLAGYAPPITMQRWSHPRGYPPILFSQTNYYEDQNKTLAAKLKAEAAYIPPRGKVVFYGLNGWAVGYDDLISVLAGLHRDDIILLSPREAAAVIEQWGAGKNLTSVSEL